MPAFNVTSAPVVELRGATKRYGAVEALRGIDLVIQPGEITAILGPNGAGKTTALSLILGLRRPTAGTVRLVGLSPENPEARARVGAMLQGSGVPPMLTVGELVELFSSYYPHPRQAAEVIGAAGLAGLEGYAPVGSSSPRAEGLDEPSATGDLRRGSGSEASHPATHRTTRTAG
jgi:ABC-type multidrug transport system ATPase subunit